MKFTSHHDAPVALPDSMRVLDATVTRRARGSGQIIGPEQRVDVITALKAMTIWPAWQHYEESAKGPIEAEKLADFAILSDDPTAVDPDTLDQIKVVETIKEGETVFALTDEEQRKADLRHKPDSRGSYAFARTLNAAARYHDVQDPALSGSTLMSHHTHDDDSYGMSCMSEVLVEIAAAMVMSNDRAPR